ncbi:hypothetical protein JHV56_06785 [Arthrobacter sp. BHU FT2]|nr:hypothetical protein [Arthrobacter sp. BHU FT2]
MVLNTPASPPLRGRRPRSWLSVPVLCAGLAVLLAACSGVSGSVASAVKDSSSAVATARLALRQDMEGKLTRAGTATTLDDALREVDTSRSTIQKLSPATQEDRDTQRRALKALEACAAAFATARAAVSADDAGSAPTTADGDRALAAAQDALEQLGDKAGGT